MNKKILIISLVIASITILSGCTSIEKNEDLTVTINPADFIYIFDVNVDKGVYDINVQNIAITNKGKQDMEIDEVKIEALRNGSAIETAIITVSDINAKLESMKSLVDQFDLDKLEFEFFSKAMLGNNPDLSFTNKLKSGQSVIFNDNYMSMAAVPDTIRITAKAKNASTENITAHADLEAKHEGAKNDYYFPLSGNWTVLNTPDPTTLHRWYTGEEFAYDFMKYGNGGYTCTGDCSKPEDYYAYGADVMAVADGEIVEVVGNLDNVSPLPQPEESEESIAQRRAQATAELINQGDKALAGNYVIIRHANEEYSFYAHLIKDSIPVSAGDQVSAGDIIGKLGNSGNSTQPHLHFHVCDAPSPLMCRSIPVKFFLSSGEQFPIYLFNGVYILNN